MESNIKGDAFLESKDIKVERSSFLRDHYIKKSLKLRDSQNPRDPFGTRLSSYWKQGDTIFTVSLKRMKAISTWIFNPDTYTKKTLLQVKAFFLKEKIRIYGMFLFVGICSFMLGPILLPKLMRARREYSFQHFKQTHMMAKVIGAKMRKAPKHQIDAMIKKININKDF